LFAKTDGLMLLLSKQSIEGDFYNFEIELMIDSGGCEERWKL
jgi:hypothetical protein